MQEYGANLNHVEFLLFLPALIDLARADTPQVVKKNDLEHSPDHNEQNFSFSIEKQLIVAISIFHEAQERYFLRIIHVAIFIV